jgi:lysylphosphatidylglycerol synthetase-like protein (DUF2156 family)
MSDTPQGEGWWMASDNKWYPPEQAPAVTSPPSSAAPLGTSGIAPPPSGMPTAPTNGPATAALVLGIVGIVFALACGLGFIAAVLAIVFGLVGMSNARKVPGEPLMSRARTGFILGTVAIVLNIVVVVVAVVLGVLGSSAVNEFEGINTDRSDGVCDSSRFLQDPDC